MFFFFFWSFSAFLKFVLFFFECVDARPAKPQMLDYRNFYRFLVLFPRLADGLVLGVGSCLLTQRLVWQWCWLSRVKKERKIRYFAKSGVCLTSTRRDYSEGERDRYIKLWYSVYCVMLWYSRRVFLMYVSAKILLWRANVTKKVVKRSDFKGKFYYYYVYLFFRKSNFQFSFSWIL